jgi:sugar (pentulose or hexulose) kinase
MAYLPQVVRPDTVVGRVSAKAAEQSGLAEGTPVLCGTTDTVMEIFAAGAVEKGQMTIKLATAGRICVVTDRPCPHPYLINYSHVIDGLYYPGTATKSCAASYRWYRDTFGGDYRSLDESAAQIDIGANGLIFKEQLIQKRREFLSLVMQSPLLQQIIKPEGITALVRSTVDDLNMESDDLVPTKMELTEQRIAAEQQQAMAAAMQQQAQAAGAEALPPEAPEQGQAVPPPQV